VNTLFVSQRKEAIEQALDEYQKVQVEFKTAKLRMEEAKIQLNKERKVTFEEWKRRNAQLKLNFD
jgi:predicted nucleic-acid-binding protein